jgi:hypothetical protein
MANLAAPAQAPGRVAQPRPARRPAPPRPRLRTQARARPRVAGGAVWIVLVAALLAGIVALNVAVLRLNMEVEQLDAERERLISRRDVLASQLSTAAAAGRIEGLAAGRLGLVAPSSTTYLELRPKPGR